MVVWMMMMMMSRIIEYYYFYVFFSLLYAFHRNSFFCVQFENGAFWRTFFTTFLWWPEHTDRIKWTNKKPTSKANDFKRQCSFSKNFVQRIYFTTSFGHSFNLLEISWDENVCGGSSLSKKKTTWKTKQERRLPVYFFALALFLSGDSLHAIVRFPNTIVTQNVLIVNAKWTENCEK